MITMPIPASESETQKLFDALEKGETITVEKNGLPFLELTGKKTKTGGWSAGILEFMQNPNPDWHLEPDFLPPKEFVTEFYNPFAENKDQ